MSYNYDFYLCLIIIFLTNLCLIIIFLANLCLIIIVLGAFYILCFFLLAFLCFIWAHISTNLETFQCKYDVWKGIPDSLVGARS